MTHLQRKRNKRKNERVGLHQDKNFGTARETVKKTQRQPKEWENIFANDTTDKKTYPRSTKNFSNSIQEKEINKSRNGQKI